MKTGSHFGTLHPIWETAARDGTSGIVGLVLNLQDRTAGARSFTAAFISFYYNIYFYIPHTNTNYTGEFTVLENGI